MMGSTKNRDSKYIMNLIKKGSIGAEIGVWEGSTSAGFLKQQPKLLYLVDPWAVSGYDEARAAQDPTHDHERYLKTYRKLAGSDNEESFNKYYDKVYARVKKRFEDNPVVQIKRMTSTEFFKSYEGDKLDWVYIDGDHSYTAVKSDLKGALKILKKGGLILGDDFHWDSKLDKGGVKKATEEFAKKNGLEIHKHKGNQFRIVV